MHTPAGRPGSGSHGHYLKIRKHGSGTSIWVNLLHWEESKQQHNSLEFGFLLATAANGSGILFIQGSEKSYREAVVLMIRGYLSKLSSIETNTEHVEGTQFTCIASVKDMDETKGWFYKSWGMCQKLSTVALHCLTETMWVRQCRWDISPGKESPSSFPLQAIAGDKSPGIRIPRDKSLGNPRICPWGKR
ncbi:hypothetical protein Tco_1330515 [Tanacetum coccineum]